MRFDWNCRAYSVWLNWLTPQEHGHMKQAFVIMPFSDTPSATEQQWTEIYSEVFRPAFDDCGYACDRAQPMTGHLLENIVERLATSSVVLADVTDRNPNVFYELGIRHSLKRGT